MDKPQIIKARSTRKNAAAARIQQFPTHYPGAIQAFNMNPSNSASHQGPTIGFNPPGMGPSISVHQGPPSRILQSNPFVPIQRSNFGEEMMEVGSAASHV